MAWQRVDSNGDKTEPRDFINWTEIGQEVEGVYMGSKERDDMPYENTTIHSVRQKNGRKAEFFGTADLNKKLGKVKQGERVKITFQGGGEPLAGGGRTRKIFDVLVDR